MVFTEECSNTSFIFDIIAEGQTEVSDVIEDEIEFLKQNYDGIEVVKLEGFYPKVLLTLEAESNPRHRVVLEVAMLPGTLLLLPECGSESQKGPRPGASGRWMSRGRIRFRQIFEKPSAPVFLLAPLV
ncbi:hypothetical protein TcYC6_0044930 [Trypanosoma cruzi]|nr:hypothetical protein TcYC6_0044930 [Trypanosoma cruzi]